MEAVVPLAPAAVLAVGALLTAAAAQLRVPAAQVIAAGAAWAALAILLLGWLPSRTVQETGLGAAGPGLQLNFRLDATSFAVEAISLAAVALLLSVRRPRAPRTATLAAVAAAAALAAVAAAGMLLAAVALGACGILLALLLEHDARQRSWSFVLGGSGACLCLAWAGATLELNGGTDQYSAAPVPALTIPIFLLVSIAALLCLGIVPGIGWLRQVWSGEVVTAAPLAAVLLCPFGVYLLARLYGVGGGRYPADWLPPLLVLAGVAAGAVAAFRAQSAANLAAFAVAAVEGQLAFALAALGAGNQLGISAALMLAFAASASALLLSGPAAPVPAARVAFGAAVLPPSIGFIGAVLGVQSLLEAGAWQGVLALAVAANWMIAILAAVRAAALAGTAGAGGRFQAAIATGALLLPGLAAGAVHGAVTGPAAHELIGQGRAAATAAGAVVAASGNIPSLALGLPLVALGGIALLITSRWPVDTAPAVPPPLLQIPALGRVTLGAREPRPAAAWVDRLELTLFAAPLGLWVVVVLVLTVVASR